MANELEDRVRARLRQLRFERGLRLSDVAAAAGMATSTLSRLESGARRLTVAQVERLAGALAVPPDRLLAAVWQEPEPAARDGRIWHPLAGESAHGRRAYRVVLPAEPGDHGLHSHPGHQWLYVLDGRVSVALERGEMVLERGEAAAIDTWMPHRVGAVGGPAEALVIFDPEGRPLRPRSP